VLGAAGAALAASFGRYCTRTRRSCPPAIRAPSRAGPSRIDKAERLKYRTFRSWGNKRKSVRFGRGRAAVIPSPPSGGETLPASGSHCAS
jgi:hypothetical protein